MQNFKAINSEEKTMILWRNVSGQSSENRRHLQQPCRGRKYKVNKDTKFTIVMPVTSIDCRSRGIVEFIDQDNPPMIQTTMRADEALSNLEISGVNASVNIEVDKDAELSIVIDKANGDFLKLKGPN
jgi:hypothetical protein